MDVTFKLFVCEVKGTWTHNILSLSLSGVNNKYGYVSVCRLKPKETEIFQSDIHFSQMYEYIQQVLC